MACDMLNFSNDVCLFNSTINKFNGVNFIGAQRLALLLNFCYNNFDNCNNAYFNVKKAKKDNFKVKNGRTN